MGISNEGTNRGTMWNIKVERNDLKREWLNSTNGSGKLESIKNKIEMARRTKWKKGMRERPLRL